MIPKRFKMGFSAISLVFRKAELGKLPVDFPHHAVAGDFGDDACRGDGKGESIALDDRIERKREIADRQSVDQAMVRRGIQCFDRAPHGKMGCPQDVEPVDFLAVRGGNRPGDLRVFGQAEIERLAFRGTEFF